MNEYVNKLNENKLFVGLMVVVVAVGGRFIIDELNDLNACISQCQSEDYTRSRAYCKRMCR